MGQIFQIPLRAGVDEGTSKKQLPPGTLLEAVNCWQDKTGVVRKRHGLMALASLSAGERIVTRGSDLAIDDGSDVRAYDASTASWRTLDRVQRLSVRRRPLIDSTRTAMHADCCIVGDRLVVVYRAGTALDYASGLLTDGFVYVRVESLSTGEVLLPEQRLGAGMYPRAVAHGSHVAVVFSSAAALGIYVFKLDMATFALTSVATFGGSGVGIGGDTIAPFDATVAGATLYIVYQTVLGTNRLAVVALDTSYAAVASSAVIGGTHARHAFCIHATAGEHVHVTYAQGNTNVGTYIWTLNAATLANEAGPSQINTQSSDYTFVTRRMTGQALVGYCRTNVDPATLETSLVSLILGTHSESVLSRRRTYGLWAPSKPWQKDGRWYCTAVLTVRGPGANVQIPNASSAVVENTFTETPERNPHIHAATLETQTGWYNQGWIKPGVETGAYAGHLPQPAFDGAGNVYVPAAYRLKEPYGNSPVTIGFNLYTLSSRDGDESRATAFSDVAVSAGGAPAAFGGVSRIPLGFLLAPCIIAFSVSGAGGSMAGGVYQYAAVYEWRDEAGNLHRSPPSPVITATVPAGSTGQVTLDLSLPSLSHKTRADDPVSTPGFLSSPVVIALYRTTVNGTILYRLTDEPNEGIVYATETAPAGIVTYVDRRPDSKINHASQSFSIPLASKPQLYTDAGELEDVAPPAFTTHTVHRGRIFGIGPDERTIWASKDWTEDDTVFPGFNEALTIAFDERKVGLKSLDERLAVFGEHGIHIVEGRGPDATGAERDWTIYRVQSDVGCTNARSLVTAPMGVAFQSARGIELLSRGLEVVWIGEPVQDTLAQFPRVTSAALFAKESQLRFTCTTADGTEGAILVFDYARRAWYVWYTQVGGGAFIDAAVLDDVYTLLTPHGDVLREDTGTHRDNGALYVSMRAKAPVYPSGPGAWQRVKDVQFVGEAVTDHDLTVTIDVPPNFAPQPKEFQIAGGKEFENVRVTLKHQKNQYFTVTIEDSAPTAPGAVVGIGAGPKFEILTVHAEPKRGMPRLSEARKG